MDHLEQAKTFANMGGQAADMRAIVHSLVDIAESLRALRPPTPAPDPKSLRFGDKVVHLPTLVPLEDAALESVGGYDDEAAS